MHIHTTLLVAFLVIAGTGVFGKDPSLYEYYTSGGIKSGLEANSPDHFTLNGKPYIIYSGSLHFFRAVPQYWRPLLQRFKAAGLNAVQFYLPWNLHEDRPGDFDFKSAALDLARFLEEIKLADMFAIVRPGPYICAGKRTFHCSNFVLSQFKNFFMFRMGIGWLSKLATSRSSS